jgi:CDP-4-dehydro-6-deoxyglucose reductase
MSEPVRFEFERLPPLKPKETPARVVRTEWLTPDTLLLAFEVDGGPMFAFHPGQYVSLVLEADPDKGLKRELRPYSLWGHPDEFEYGVTIAKMVDGGRCTSWLRTLKPGDPLRFVAPLGAFWLRRPLHRNLYFVATGTGVVPLRSMLKDMVATGELRHHDATLLFGLRAERDLFAVDDFEKLAAEFPRFRFIPTLSRPSAAWTGARGRVTAHLEAADLPVDDMQVYLCGNGAMIEDALNLLDRRGLDRRTRRVVFEKYFD